MPDFVGSTLKENVAIVSINRPDLHNAFNEVVIEELTSAFEELGKDKDVRVIVLRGEGKSFCAGADVNWMSKMVGYSLDENVADASAMARMLRTIRDCPKPTIARVHGAAIGGGVGLTAACDIAVALTSAMFCLSEVKLGIIPAVISPFVMEKIGPGHMRRYALTAERFGAAEAKRIGLVHDVVQTEEELDEHIDSIARTLIANGPAALAAAKRTLTDVAGMQWDAIQKLTTRRVAEIRVSPEGQEGLKAFLEKREPKWPNS